MRILSLFDGVSALAQAFKDLGLTYSQYYASEIHKPSIKISKANHPDIIQIGNVKGVKGNQFPPIDLLTAGSPCQSFSYSGKQLNFNDPRGRLFFEFVRVLEECQPKYFLLENVRMKQEWQDIITSYLGVSPYMIDSRIFSAQSRKRLYWTNLPLYPLPKDLGHRFQDIMPGYVPAATRTRKGKVYVECRKDFTKSNCVLSSRSSIFAVKGLENAGKKFLYDEIDFVRYDPEVCEALQTFPIGYTKSVSKTQRYKALGNAWNVRTIVHILQGLK